MKWNESAKNAWVVYAMDTNRSMKRDLSNEITKVQELEGMWLSWAKKAGVRNWDTKELIQ